MSSIIKVDTIQLADGTAGTIENLGLATGALSHRNLIINGDMRVAQRGSGPTTTSGAGVYDTVDRMRLWEDTDGTFTSEQSSEAPDGFSNSLKLVVTTADTSLAAAQYACFAQLIEGQNLQHLAYGTNAAKTITLSFWVRSSKTGTYSICLDKSTSTSYKYVKEYTISSANTWEKKTITIEPDSNIQASGGAIANDNNIGFRVFINLAWGSSYNTATDNTWNNNSQFATTNQVNWMDSTSNDFYFTGFQLEVGSVATPFEHRSYGEELALCQRYYQKRPYVNDYPVIWTGDITSGNTYYTSEPFSVVMRTAPTVTITSENASGINFGGTQYNTAYGIRAYGSSTSTMARGYFQFAYTADAEL